jgi:hypothetical protein
MDVPGVRIKAEYLRIFLDFITVSLKITPLLLSREAEGPAL